MLSRCCFHEEDRVSLSQYSVSSCSLPSYVPCKSSVAASGRVVPVLRLSDLLRARTRFASPLLCFDYTPPLRMPLFSSGNNNNSPETSPRRLRRKSLSRRSSTYIDESPSSSSTASRRRFSALPPLGYSPPLPPPPPLVSQLVYHPSTSSSPSSSFQEGEMNPHQRGGDYSPNRGQQRGPGGYPTMSSNDRRYSQQAELVGGTPYGQQQPRGYDQQQQQQHHAINGPPSGYRDSSPVGGTAPGGPPKNQFRPDSTSYSSPTPRNPNATTIGRPTSSYQAGASPPPHPSSQQQQQQHAGQPPSLGQLQGSESQTSLNLQQQHSRTGSNQSPGPAAQRGGSAPPGPRGAATAPTTIAGEPLHDLGRAVGLLKSSKFYAEGEFFASFLSLSRTPPDVFFAVAGEKTMGKRETRADLVLCGTNRVLDEKN